MAIPNNYIDKITNKDTGESRIISPAADKVRVDNENYEGADLNEVLDEVAQAIDDAGGGYEPPQDGIPRQDLEQSVQDSLELADSSLQPSDKTQLQGAITQLQNALNTLIGSGNVQGAIDTFNEVTAFLNGIDTDDPTLANQLNSLNNAISALQTSLAGKISGIKANGASETLPVENGIVTLPPAGSTISPATNAPVMDGTAGVGSSEKYAREDHVHPHDTSKQDTLTWDNAPTAGSNNPVKSGGIKTAIDQVTPTINENGKWVIGGVATDNDAQGPRGNSVLVNEGSTAIQAIIVNNLVDGGETDILSAEMGKVLRQNIMKIFNALGVYAFPEGKPTLNWGSTVINHSINVNGVTGGLTIADVEIDGVSAASLPAQIVEGKSLSLRLVLPSNLYVFSDGVSITMGGVNITNNTGVWDESTGEINIASVADDIVITAAAITYVGYGENNSPLVLMLDGKNQGSTANQWENMCDTNKPLVLSGGYTKSSDHVAFDGVDGNGVIDQLNINMPYKTTSVETVFSSASMPPTTNSILLINNYAENTLMIFGTGSGIYANRLLLYACTKYYQEETASGYTSPLLDTGAGNYMFSANQVVRLCRYGQQFNLNNNTLVNTNENEGLRINVGKDASVLGDFSVSGFISRQGTYFGPFNGSLYCARVYNRILTDNEKAQNYKVDQKRFNLA